MNKIILTLFILIWIFSLFILVISLTNLFPNNPFKEYRFIVGLGFIIITWLLKYAYKKLAKPE